MEPSIFLKMLETTDQHGNRLLSATFAVEGENLSGHLELALARHEGAKDAEAVGLLQTRLHEVLTSLAEQTKPWASL